MFSQHNEEQKLDWIYKGPNSLVNREEYLLGRTVDKTLEQLNDEEKQKQFGLTAPKNRVEHECIPPSIRDFNKIVQSEQVDLSTKLQEDPLVAIKKREEECRRQFLQNPVQLKKLQKALKAQEAKKNKKKKRKKHKKGKDDNGTSAKKKSKTNSDLDTILIHKFNELKDKFSENDMKEILAINDSSSGSSSSSSSSNSEEDYDLDTKLIAKLRKIKNTKTGHTSSKNHETNKKNVAKQTRQKYCSSSESSSDEREKINRKKHVKGKQSKKVKKSEMKSSRNVKKYRESGTEESTSEHKGDINDSESDSVKNKPRNWGLVKSDGSRIPLNRRMSDMKYHSEIASNKKVEVKPIWKNDKKIALTDDEKERRRKEMMANAVLRDKERSVNYKRHKESEDRERKQMKDFDPEFAHKQLLKSANSSSVESRIKANLNKIQRSSKDMNTHFSRR